MWATISVRFFLRANAIISRASRIDMLIGFSINRCLPAFKASMAHV